MPESKIVVANVATNVSTEGVVGVSDTVRYTQPGGEGLAVRGVLNVLAGTGTTAVVIRCRRGNGLAGALVTPTLGLTHTLAAAASANIPYEFIDTAPTTDPLPSSAGGAQNPPGNLYTITLQQTGGTGGGTVVNGTIGLVPVTAGW